MEMSNAKSKFATLATKAEFCRLPSCSYFISIILGTGVDTANSQTKIGCAGGVVYAFLAEDCPISQSYTLTLQELHRTYTKTGFEFVGVFPIKDESTMLCSSLAKGAYTPEHLIKIPVGAKVHALAIYDNEK